MDSCSRCKIEACGPREAEKHLATRGNFRRCFSFSQSLLQLEVFFLIVIFRSLVYSAFYPYKYNQGNYYVEYG